MCKLGVLLIIHDQEMNKVIEYNSGSMQGGLFTIKKAVKV